jgi:hypothetical protein
VRHASSFRGQKPDCPGADCFLESALALDPAGLDLHCPVSQRVNHTLLRSQAHIPAISVNLWVIIIVFRLLWDHVITNVELRVCTVVTVRRHESAQQRAAIMPKEIAPVSSCTGAFATSARRVRHLDGGTSCATSYYPEKKRMVAFNFLFQRSLSSHDDAVKQK